MALPVVIDQMAGGTLRRFDGTPPTIEQPALDENVVSIHLGGPKRVRRWQGRHRQEWDVPVNAITLMPAFRANRWHTEGVIAFAHLTLSAELLARLAREEFDREPGELLLLDRVGLVDPLVSELMLALGREADAPGPRRLYRDCLLTTLGLALLKQYTTLAPTQDPDAAANRPARGGLAGWQLRRVQDYMAANLERDGGLDEMVQITGLSRAQFFRAFRRSTGDTPARYMQRLRMSRAGALLLEGQTVGEVTRRLGYGSGSHFASAFRRVNGANPVEWYRSRRARAAE